MDSEKLCYSRDDLPWYVAHTRPRCEKRLMHYCRREGLPATVPCAKSIKKYGRRTFEFERPVFPGYVFFRSLPERVRNVRQSDYTANVLTVPDQETFQSELREILLAVEESRLFIGVVPLKSGTEARITGGPLAGLSGLVHEISDHTTVVLRLDFIGLGAAVLVERSHLEPIV